MVDKGLVDVASTKVSVERGSVDGQLTLLEGDDGRGEVGVSNIDEAHAAGLLISGGEIKLGDTPSESSGGGIVHQAEELETGDIGSIHYAAALRVGEPRGNRQHNVGDGGSKLSGSGGLDLGEVHGHKLCRREDLVLSKVPDPDTDISVLGLDELGRDELLLDGDLGVVEFPPSKALQVGDGVLEVGDLLGLCGLSDVSALGTESDDRTVSRVSIALDDDGKGGTHGVERLETSLVI